MKKKIRVAVLFGGKSAEHEVSIQSAITIVSSLDPKKYDVSLIGITKSGHWQPVSVPALMGPSGPAKLTKGSVASALSVMPQGDGRIVSTTGMAGHTSNFDVVIPVLHGPFGEDGTVQGLLKLANVPFVGADVLGSAVGMDKDIMKRLLRDAGIPIGHFETYRVHDRKKISYAAISKRLGRTVFVKPANLGSSVGVSKATNKKEFDAAIETAFRFDSKILVEAFIQGREIECSVLGNEYPEASVPGEVIPNTNEHGFFSYEAKYTDEHGADFIIPARLSKKQIATVQRLAVDTFRTLSCEGLGRVDLFMTPDGNFIVNEINTFPGFTSVSMYPKLWEASGLSYSKLIDRLIELAFERFKRDSVHRTSRGND